MAAPASAPSARPAMAAQRAADHAADDGADGLQNEVAMMILRGLTPGKRNA